LFGSTPAPTPSAFGAPAPSGGLFGSTPAPAPFGGGFGFSSPAPAPSGGLFGQPAPSPSGGLFGQPAPAPTGGLFGQPAPAPSAFGSAFGAPQQPQMPGVMMAAPPVGSVMPPAAQDILASQLAALEKKRKELEERDNFRNKPAASAAVTAVSLGERDRNSFGPLTPARISHPSAYRASPMSSAKVRPRGFASPDKTANIPQSLSKLGTGGKPMAAPETFAASSATRLIVAPSPKLKLSLGGGDKLKKLTEPSPLKIAAMTNGNMNSGIGSVKKATTPNSPYETPDPVATPNGTSPATQTRAQQYYQQVICSPPADEAAGVGNYGTPHSESKRKTIVPKLTKEGYTCHPSIDTLAAMDPADLAAVPNFTVSRAGVGSVAWEGAVDVRGADLDRVVSIEPKSVSVYTEEEEKGTKPSAGTKLNRSAVLTMEGVFPPENGTAEATDKFCRKVAKQTAKMNAELISYDPIAGEWQLRVAHFSRYALDDNDDSDEEMVIEETKTHKVTFMEPVLSPKGGERTINREKTPFKSRTASDEVDMVVTMIEEKDVLEQAEDAYSKLQSLLAAEEYALRKKKVKEAESTPFPEELEELDETMPTARYVPTFEDIESASGRPSFTASLKPKTSSFDYGIQGRGFRVSFFSNGSFLTIGENGAIKRLRPKLTEKESSASEESKLLQCHRSASQQMNTKDSNCPFFAIVPTIRGASLEKTLDSYSKAGNGSSASAFKLLEVIQESLSAKASKFANQGRDYGLESRHLSAIANFLVCLCSDEVRSEISLSNIQKGDFKPLLAAVSAGDIRLACKISQDMGLVQLSILLGSGPAARKAIQKEVSSWPNLPPDLERIYRIVAGDFATEERRFPHKDGLFDWKRRIASQLTFSTSTGPIRLKDFLERYEQDAADDVLFLLLKMDADKNTFESLGQVVNGCSASMCFHLSSCISAMADQPKLSAEEEYQIINSYVTQLLGGGLWHWAVYCVLCVMATKNSSTELHRSWRIQQAKTLVMMNYTEADEKARAFLQNSCGIPPEWFEESLAYRSSSQGDSYGFISHMMNAGQIAEATAALEKTILPNVLFISKDKLPSTLKLIDAFSSEEDNLISIVNDLAELARAVIDLDGASPDQVAAAAPALLDTCSNIENFLSCCRSTEHSLSMSDGLDMVPETYLVPMGSFLAEALSFVANLRLQILARSAGMPRESLTSQMLKLARSGSTNLGEEATRWLL
jgi:nuclear pore complex protein Nup98-Nup96